MPCFKMLNINKSLWPALDNFLHFKCYIRSFHTSIKIIKTQNWFFYSQICHVVGTFVRRRLQPQCNVSLTVLNL